MMESDPSLLSLEATLERNFPGLDVLDRDLELSERFRADLVAIERSGRLVLVLLVEGEGDEPLLAALEALAFTERNAAVLAAHFEEPRLRTDQPPRVLLIAQRFPPKLTARLRPLFDSSVELFEVRSVKSARGENVFLASVGGEPQVLATSGAATEEAFVGRLGPDQESIARHAIERMARIDEDLLLSTTGARIQWSFRGTDLARLELVGDRLQGSVAPDNEARALRSSAQVDFFVEEVLARYVSCLGMGAESSDSPDQTPERPPKRPPEMPPEATELDLPPLAESPLEGGNLTSEELRAFQE